MCAIIQATDSTRLNYQVGNVDSSSTVSRSISTMTYSPCSFGSRLSNRFLVLVKVKCCRWAHFTPTTTHLSMSAQDWWRTEPDVGKSGRTEPVAAPEAKIGSWWLTTSAPTPIRCKGYSYVAWDKTHRHILEDNRRRHIHWTRDGGKGGSHVCHNICARVVDQCLEKDTEKKQDWVFFCDSGARGRSASLERQWLVRRALMSCAHSFLMKCTKPKLPCERT